MHLLALQQPMAKDLRIIGTALKITTDLERIGDYSVDIAKSAVRLSTQPYARPLVRIPRMAELAGRMVRGSLAAFVTRDLSKIDEVIELDDAVDDLYRQIWRALLDEMAQGLMPHERGVRLILVARYLERIADHATNVAERVHYMETGVLHQLVSVHQNH
jgi:phosphate transport system protein